MPAALIAVLALTFTVVLDTLSGGGSPRGHSRAPGGDRGRSPGHTRTGTGKRAPVRRRRPEPGPPYPVAHLTRVFIDRSRTVSFPGRVPIFRNLRTLVLYPQTVSPRHAFPLLVFGHGFAVTPLTYGSLLHFWASQGFVVAAPFFPLESHNALGGPNESDLPNQPRDMSFVISQMLAQSAAPSGVLSGLIDRHQIAVAGQSDGGDTALAVAYGGVDRDLRVKAAVILSGAEIPGVSLAYFPPGSPPLLAVQGTADTINAPSFTYQFFSAAPAPKFLLTLPGAAHLPPYQRPPDLAIVERVSVAFLRRYLQDDHAAGRRLVALGDVPGLAELTAYP